MELKILLVQTFQTDEDSQGEGGNAICKKMLLFSSVVL